MDSQTPLPPCDGMWPAGTPGDGLSGRTVSDLMKLQQGGEVPGLLARASALCGEEFAVSDVVIKGASSLAGKTYVLKFR